MTNLDIIRRHFPKAKYVTGNQGDFYELNKNWTINHIEGGTFSVDHSYRDSDVGIVSNTDVYHGDLIECLDFVLRYYDKKTTERDRKDYEKIVKGEN